MSSLDMISPFLPTLAASQDALLPSWGMEKNWVRKKRILICLQYCMLWYILCNMAKFYRRNFLALALPSFWGPSLLNHYLLCSTSGLHSLIPTTYQRPQDLTTVWEDLSALPLSCLSHTLLLHPYGNTYRRPGALWSLGWIDPPTSPFNGEGNGKVKWALFHVIF